MAQFRGYAQPRGFSPIEAPDVASKTRERGRQQLQDMERAAQFDLQQRDRMASAMRYVNEVEARNRDKIFQADQDNRDRVQKQIQNNYRTTIENAVNENKGEIDTLTSLAKFSTTAFDTVVKINQNIEEGKKLAVHQAIFNTGVSNKQLMELHKLGVNANSQSLAENSRIVELSNDLNVPIQDLVFLAKHSNAKYWSTSTAVLGNMAGSYQTHFDNNINTKFKIKDKELSLQEARDSLDGESEEAIKSRILSEFIRENLIRQNVDPSAAAQFVHPTIRAVHAEWAKEGSTLKRKIIASNAQDAINNTYSQAFSTGGAASVLAMIQQQPAGFARSKAWVDLSTYLQTEALTDNWRWAQQQLETLDSLKVDWDGREVTFKERFEKTAWYIATKQAFLDARVRDQRKHQINENDDLIRQQEWTDFAIEELQKNPDVVMADVNGAIEAWKVQFPGKPIPSELETFKLNNTVDGKFIAAKIKQVQSLDDAGVLTLEMITEMGLPNSVVPSDVRARAISRSKAQQEDPRFDGMKETLMDLAKSPRPVQAKVQGQYDPSVRLMGSHLMRQFLAEFNKLELISPGDPRNSDNAYSIVRDRFYANAKDPKFFVTRGSGLGGYSQFNRPADVDKNAAARGAQIQRTIGTLGAKALTTPGAIFSVPELEAYKQDAMKPNFAPDGRIKGIANQLRMNPIAVLDTLMQSNGLGKLPVPQFFTQFRQQADPALLRKLEAYQTEQISVRTMGSTGTYNIDLVPNKFGYNIGQLILETATKYKLSPGLLAGMLHHESIGFKDTVLTGEQPSPSGALGIAQLKPETAAEMGVDPLNIPQAIDGAARYLIKMLNHPNNPQKSMNRAIQMYHDGPTGILSPSSNPGYFNSVMSQAYKYGHLQSLQSRATLRPGFIQRTSSYDTGYGWQPVSMQDEQGRPVIMSRDAATAFAQMVQASGGAVKGSDIASSQRTKEKNIQAKGSPTSLHLHGEAIDIHGTSKKWMIQNGPKFGWYLVDYPGSHGGHFEYRGN
jgi:soluble lytic murein transglycosylase-like protein